MNVDLYRHLRRLRPDWPPIEAARVAVAYPGLSPRDAHNRSVAFADSRREQLAQELCGRDDDD